MGNIKTGIEKSDTICIQTGKVHKLDLQWHKRPNFWSTTLKTKMNTDKRLPYIVAIKQETFYGKGKKAYKKCKNDCRNVILFKCKKTV